MENITRCQNSMTLALVSFKFNVIARESWSAKFPSVMLKERLREAVTVTFCFFLEYFNLVTESAWSGPGDGGV